jgi:flagellar biogenesis protein FliO
MTYEALVLQKTPIVTFGYIVQVALSLAIVVALIYLCAKYLLPRLKITPKGLNFEVTDRMGLEPQVTLYRVKSGNREYLIGVSSKSIALIDKFEKKIGGEK